MSKLAVDVVLLPDAAMSEKAIALSGRLQQKEKGPFKLGKTDYLPHITVFMGVLDEADLAFASQKLKEIAKSTPALSLVSEKVEGIPSSVGGVVSCIDVTKTPALQVLHGTVAKEIGPLLSFDSSPDIFVEPATIQEGTMRFIRNFPKKFDWNEFHPHITVGRGAVDEPFDRTEFTASTLALCQLGQFCTCRKVLFSVELNRR